MYDILPPLSYYCSLLFSNYINRCFAQTTAYMSIIHRRSFYINLIWSDTSRGSRKNPDSWNGATFAGGVFRNLAGTGINQNCIAPRSRITSRNCFCATDALHVSPTWNSFTAPSFRSRGSKIEEQFARNSGAIRKKRRARFILTSSFTRNFRGELETATSTFLGLLKDLSSPRVAKCITCSSQSRVIFRVKEDYLP